MKNQVTKEQVLERYEHLKSFMSKHLLSAADIDKPYISWKSGRSYSRRELSEVINSDSEDGVYHLYLIINLAIDLMERHGHNNI